MAKSLNFNKIPKQYLTVTFADEKATTIFVCMPTKSLLRELTELTGDLTAEANIDATDELYDVCAKVMSRNKTGAKITKEFLEDIFDFEDILIFLKEYMSFVGGVASLKN
jgi:hypothetical protein